MDHWPKAQAKQPWIETSETKMKPPFKYIASGICHSDGTLTNTIVLSFSVNVKDAWN
jgi:hypothetical protein